VAALGRGRIVLVEVTDPQGHNKKPCPVVVVTAAEEIREGSPLVGVAVSTTFPHPVPEDCVELPYDPTGKSKTGLRRRSVAVCSWRQALTPADVIRDIGRVPDRQMLAILEKVKRYTEPNPPAAQTE